MKKSREAKRGLFLSSLQAQPVCFLSALLLLVIFCTAAYSTADPDKITFPLSLCALYLSSLIGGIAAVRFSGAGIVSGFLTGGITAVLLWIISLLPLPDSGTEFPEAIVYIIMVIPASVIGAVLGRKRKEKPEMRARRRKNIR